MNFNVTFNSDQVKYCWSISLKNKIPQNHCHSFCLSVCPAFLFSLNLACWKVYTQGASLEDQSGIVCFWSNVCRHCLVCVRIRRDGKTWQQEKTAVAFFEIYYSNKKGVFYLTFAVHSIFKLPPLKGAQECKTRLLYNKSVFKIKVRITIALSVFEIHVLKQLHKHTENKTLTLRVSMVMSTCPPTFPFTYSLTKCCSVFSISSPRIYYILFLFVLIV